MKIFMNKLTSGWNWAVVVLFAHSDVFYHVHVIAFAVWKNADIPNKLYQKSFSSKHHLYLRPNPSNKALKGASHLAIKPEMNQTSQIAKKSISFE